MIEIGRSGCAPAQRHRKAAGGALLILMAGLTGCAPKLAPKAPPPLVTVAQPITRRIIDWDEYVSQFVAPESVEVRPRVAGYIQSIAFKDGAEVRKGDLLFVIDPRPYKAVLDQAKAQQHHAQAAVQGAEIEERWAEGLVEAKALSDQDLQTRKSTLAQARADLESRQSAEDPVRVTVAAETTRAHGLPMADVIEEGNVGLMQAVRRFDTGRDCRLATYALWWIKATIQEYVLRSWSLVKLGTTANQKKLFFGLRRAKSRIAAFEEGDLHPDRVAAIAILLGVQDR